MKKRFIFIILLISLFVIYLITSNGNTPYNYFILLADSFINGRLYLTQNPAWLNELIPLGDNRFAVVYPPTPAIIAMPFVYFFGNTFPQQILAHLFGAGFAVITAKIAYLRSRGTNMFIWFLLLSAFGTIMWYLSSNGSVWYLGQVSGAFFLISCIYESLTKKRPIVVSLLFGLAVLSRLQIILASPILIFLNYKETKLNINKVFQYIFPFSLLISLYLIYNYLRFGSAFETGYSLIPNVLNEPWYSKGIFSLSYIPSNLKVMFLSLPILKNEFPYITPSWGGLSILITTPAFLYMFGAKLNNKENLVTYVSMFLIALITLSHGGTGFTQFGYRYAVDFYPLIFLLLSNSLTSKRIKWHHWFLLFFCILVNLWGVLWINKFGWVSF